MAVSIAFHKKRRKKCNAAHRNYFRIVLMLIERFSFQDLELQITFPPTRYKLVFFANTSED